jgi:hypothetical protein
MSRDELELLNVHRVNACFRQESPDMDAKDALAAEWELREGGMRSDAIRQEKVWKDAQKEDRLTGSQLMSPLPVKEGRTIQRSGASTANYLFAILAALVQL